MLKLTLVFSFISFIFGTGYIHHWDYSVDYTNSGYLKSFSFGFSLDNGISSSDYIQIIFPFALHSTVVLSNDFSVYLKLVGKSGCTPIQTTSTNVFLSATIANAYYIQFLDEKGEINKPLAANTWYILKFVLKNALNIAKGIYAPIQIFSISSYDQNGLIYDYNKVFANIEIAKSPQVNSLQFTSTINNPNSNDIDSIYSVVFDIVPSFNITNQARIFILMKNNAWSFNGDSCISIDKNITVILDNGTSVIVVNPALNSLQFSCEIDSIENIAVINLNSSLLASSHYIFSVSIRNPKYVIQSGGFEVRTLLSNTNTIIEHTFGSTAFSINPLSWGTSNKNLNVQLGWGVDISQPNLPDQFVFFRGSAAVNPFKFYNAIKFIFSPSYETGSGVQLKIVLRLDAEIGFEVLSGSISENLPSYGSSQVFCSLDTTVNTNKITCYNVGVLSNLSNYHIGLKAYFPYDANVPEADLSSNFGNLAIYTYNSLLGDYDALPLIPEGRCQAISYATKNNLHGILPMTSPYCYTMAHSQTGANVAAVSTSNCGIKTTSNYQNLVFTLTATTNQIYGTTFNTFAGFSIYTNKFIQESTSYSATDPIKDGNSISTQSTDGTDTLNARAGHDYSYGKKWTWFKIYAMNTASFNAFKGTSGSVFGVKNILITSKSGNYAEDNCFDFYIATYNNIEGTTPVLNNIFAFNSYAVSETYIGKGDNSGNIKLAIVNFWTGPVGGGSQQGSLFPLFIRIFGYLDSSSMTNVKKLALFFDNLEYFSSSSYNSIDVVDCSSSFGASTNCYGYKGQLTTPLLLNSLHNLNRIEIDVEGILSGTGQASPFQILIPMKSIENIGTINLQLATMTTDYFYGIYKPYTSILNIFNTFYQASFVSKTYASIINTGILTNINYKLSFAENPSVGITAYPTGAKINCGHDDSTPPLVNFNANPDYGAGFTYISEYNMIGSGFFVSSSLINTQITSERCLQFTYTYNNAKIKYGFFCPFAQSSISGSSFLSALNFIYPYANGQRIVDNTYGVWSDKSGNLISYQWHSNSAGIELFIKGNIVLNGLGVTPSLIKGATNQKLSWNFNLSNPLPIDGKIKVTFATSTWSFSPDINEKCVMKAILLANSRNHDCIMTMTANQYIVFTFSASSSDLSPFPAGQYSLIQYGVDKDNSNGLTLSFTIETFTSNNYLIDGSGAFIGSLQFNNGVNNAKLSISNVLLQTLTQGFRDNFQFEFSLIGKYIYFNEQFYINLGALALKTLSNQVFCTIYEDKVSSFDWKEVDFSVLTNIKLTPKADITILNKIYTFVCEGLYIPNVNTPGLSMTLLHGSTIVHSSTEYNYPVFLPPFNGLLITPNLTLYKSMNAYGQILELTFEVLLDLDLNSNHSIILNLPIEYNSKSFCNCWINDIETFCYYPRNHTIIIEGIDQVLAANSSFNITVYGVINPKIINLSTQTTFLIGFNQSNNPNVLTYYGEISDVISQSSSIGSLSIVYGSVSNYYVLEKSSLTFSFNYLPIDVSVNQSLILDFEDWESYGKILKRTSILSCRLIEKETGANFVSSCVLKGLRIKFTMNSDLNSSSLYDLTIDNFPNPEYINCNIKKPTISIIDIDYKTVLYRTNTITVNIANSYVKQSPSLQYTQWFDATGGRIVHNHNVFEIKIGMFSKIIKLIPISKPFFQFLGLNLTKSTELMPTLLQGTGIKTGDISYSFRIGCPSNMSQQVIEYLINKIDTGNITYYSNLEQLSLSLLKQQTTIQPNDRFIFSIANLGRSLPIIFDFTDNCPYDFLTINFTIVFSVTDIGYIFQESGNITQIITVDSQNPIFKLQVLSTQNNTIDSGSYGQIIFTFLAGNIDSYTYSPSPILLQSTYGDPNILPSITIIFAAYSTKATEEVLNVEVSKTSTVYCYIALVLSDSLSRDFNYTREMADQNYQIKADDRYQEQFLAWYIEDFLITYDFSIYNLKSKKNYQFTCWAMDLFENASLSSTGKFSMLDNGGKIMRFGLSFAGELSSYQKEQISCFLCTYFAIPCQNVQTHDNYYCPYTSYLDLLYANVTNVTTNSSNTTVIINSTNTTDSTNLNTTLNDITTSNLIISTNSTNSSNLTNSTTNLTNSTTNVTNSTTNVTNSTTNVTNSTTNATNSTTNSTNAVNSTNSTSQANQSNITNQETHINFYFLPLDNQEVDSSSNDVTEETQKSYFQSYFLGNLTTLPKITYFLPISEVSEIDPEFDSTMTLNTSFGGTWVALSGLRMVSRGFVLISVEENLDIRKNNTNNTNSTNATIDNSTNMTNSTDNLTNTTNISTSNQSNTSFDINIFGGRRILQTNSTLNLTNLTSENTTLDFLTLFQPSPAQIKLKLNFNNESVLVSRVSFYNYSDASINITGLNYSTNYRIYYTASSENPAVYCLLGNQVLSLNITTKDKFLYVKYAIILERNIVLIILSLLVLISFTVK